MPIINNFWKDYFEVRLYEEGIYNHVPMQVICRYLQESASNHMSELGFSAKKLFLQNQIWVLSRLHVNIQKYPSWNERIKVETWLSGIKDSFLVFRDFHILYENNEIIGKATSLWLLLDLNTRRPIRVSKELLNFPSSKSSLLNINIRKQLERPKKVDIEKKFWVRLSDLDLNQHVNNTIYIEWFLETVPQDIWQNYFITSLEIDFRAESVYGDLVVSQTERDPKELPLPYIFKHRIFGSADNQELAVAKTVWFQKNSAHSSSSV
jgi:acyl-ACP thioesterase